MHRNKNRASRPSRVDAAEKCPAVIDFAIEEAFGPCPGWASPPWPASTTDQIAMPLTQSTRTLYRLADRVSAVPTS